MNKFTMYMIVLALAIVDACGTEAETMVCTPKDTQTCQCDDGSSGKSTCTATGEEWSSCVCSIPLDAGYDDATTADGFIQDGATGSDTASADIVRVDSSLPDNMVECADAGSTSSQLLAFNAPNTGRGPVRIELVFATSQAIDIGLQFNTGAGYTDATLFLAASEQTTQQLNACSSSATLVWDSYTDIDSMAEVSLRIVQRGTSVTPFAPEHNISIDNAADRDRVLLAAHPSAIQEDGGATNINTKVSVLVLHTNGTGSDSSVDLEVGTGPDAIAFAASGRFAVVHNGRNGTLSFVDVVGLTASARPVMDLTPRRASSMALAADERSMFVVAAEGSVYYLVEYELRAGVAHSRREIALPSPTGCVAVSPRGDLVAVSRAAASDDNRTLELFSRADLTLVGTVDYPGTLCDALRFSADGLYLASIDGMYGNLVTTFETYSGGLLRIADSVTLNAPYDIAFHPSTSAALVSVLGDDSVMPCLFNSNGELSTQIAISGGLPQAAEMDMLKRGSLQGLAAISALSSVVLVQLNSDGTAAKTHTIDTGSAYSDIVQGVAFQP